MSHKQLVCLSFVTLLGLSGCAPVTSEAQGVSPTPRANLPDVSLPHSARMRVDSIMARLDVRQKVAQLIMPWMLGNYTAFGSEEFAIAATWVDSLELGGIIVSVGSPLDAAAKLNALQDRSQLPLLIAADLEWGSGMRLVGGTLFPMPMAIGATGRDVDAYELGRITALEARAAGIHMTFSPVADINNNPDNPIINTRSFGEDPSEVAPLIRAYIRGATEQNLFTTAKHFPGHGDTGTDSHIDLPVVSACWDRLDTLELKPFRAAIDAGVTAVMTAHLALPCIDGPDDPPPATFSPTVMSDILRDSLGFGGLVVTDALTMGAIVQKYGTGESVVRAFLAGSDLLLIPADPREAVNAMERAVRSGRVSQARLDVSVRRLLTLKERAGLFEKRKVVLDSIPAIINHPAFQEAADDIAQRSLTLIQRGPIDAFRRTRGRTAVILYAEETNHFIGDAFIRELRDYGEAVEVFRLYPASGPVSYDSARTVIGSNPRVAFATSVRFIAGRGHIQMPDPLASLILATDRRKPTVLVSLGSPYLLDQVSGFSGGFLLAWSDVPATERAAARAIAAGAAVVGKLPISLSPHYRRGYGITLPQR